MAEKALLKYCNWKININAPCDFIDIIYNNLELKYNNNESAIEKINKYKDISITLLEFAICEYSIFSEYNQIIISLSSCLITINQNFEEESNEFSEKIDIQNELKEIIENILNKISFDKNLIDSCSSLILKFLEKDDDENEKEDEEIKEKKEDILSINSQLEITRSESDESFCDVINNYIIDKNEDSDSIISSKENNNVIDLGIISPIFHEETILLKKEKNYDLESTKNKKRKEKKNKNEIFDDANLLLLNRKRNGKEI